MRGVVGMSEETTCYVSLAHFAEEDEFADYVVHEAAHVFHNTKRRTAGLPETRRRQWLLPIAFEKRETFAFACERYSRILKLGKRPADRRWLLDILNKRPPLPKNPVSPADSAGKWATEPPVHALETAGNMPRGIPYPQWAD